jgi:putative transposase
MSNDVATQEQILRRAYRFLLRPTGRQIGALAACLEDHRQLYNAALEHRRTAYRMCGVTVRYGEQSAELKDIRAFDPHGQGRWSFSSQQATLRRLDKAMVAFFRRVKNGETPGYPRFKGRGWFDSVTWPSDRDGCRWDSQPHERAARVYLQGVGHVRVHQHRPIDGRVRTITVKREGRRWYVVLSCDQVPAKPLEPTGAVAGIDMGIASVLTTSDGEHIANPRHLATSATKLAVAQQRLARCKRSSNRRQKQRARVAAAHCKIRRQRLDHAHKTALDLVRRYDLIAHEDLAIASMTRRPAPRPDGQGGYEPNRAAAKAGLNRSILDAGWGVFLAVLAHAAESAQREVIAVNPRYTSQTCSACGHVASENRATQAELRCVTCGFEAHADHNAAANILRAGLALRVVCTRSEKPAAEAVGGVTFPPEVRTHAPRP